MHRYEIYGDRRAQVLHYVLVGVAVALCTTFLIYLMGDMLSSVSIGSISFSYMNLPVILISGLFGFVPAMVSFLLVFVYEAVVNTGLAYTVFIYLLAASISYLSARRGWLRSWKGIIGSSLLLSFVLGNVWDMLVRLIDARGFSNLSAAGMLTSFIAELPECFISVLILAALLNLLPDRAKKLFYMGYYYASDTRENASRTIGGTSRLSLRITALIIVEAFVLGGAAAGFANLLIPSLVQTTGSSNDAVQTESQYHRSQLEKNSSDTSDDFGTSGSANPGSSDAVDGFERYWDSYRFVMNEQGIAFDVKLILLLLNVAVPFSVIANYYAQYFVARPIVRMAKTMSDFSEAEDRESELTKVHALNIRQNDEIGDLYEALDQMAAEIVDYIGRIRREEKLEAELTIAKRSNEAKTRFLNNMSHEIRTPINAVLGLDELILRESREKQTLEYARDIDSAGRTLLSLVNDILDSSKLEAGKMEIVPVEYELSSTVNDLVHMISARAQEKNLRLFVRLDPSTPHLLYGDEIRLKQVIWNILTNAVKYTEQGSVTFSVGYEPKEDHQILLKVSVRDTGIGIRAEDIPKLFERFERIDLKHNNSIEGTGLGMSIVRQLLALMGTELHVKSTYGEGSDFSFEVLQKVLDDVPVGDWKDAYAEADAQTETYHESFRAPEARILVVDDTPLNLTVVRGLLRQTQVQIDTADSGQEALDLVRKNAYDLVFLDHRMPQMDGTECLRKMREMKEENKSKNAPVVALTANAIAGAREQYLQEGFTEYLSKPVNAHRLEALLLRLLPPDKVLRRENDMEGASAGTAGAEGAPKAGKTVSMGADVPAAALSDDGGEDEKPTWLDGVTSIDYDMAIENCGSLSVFLDVLKQFLGVIPEKSSQIEEFAAEGDLENYTILVHALKSSARLIGAPVLSGLAAELEKAGDAGDRETIDRDTPELLKEYRSYFDKITPLLADGSDEADARPLIDSAELADAYAAVREFAEAFDFDSADDVMAMLADYRMPPEEKERYETVARLVKEVDREALLLALGEKDGSSAFGAE